MDDIVPGEKPTIVSVSGTDSIEPDMSRILVDKRTALMETIKALEARVCEVDEEFRAKIDDLQARKKHVEEALFHVEALLRIDGREVSPDTAWSGKRSQDVEIQDLSVIEAAFVILQRGREPLHYREITRMVQERGIYVPGKNPAATLLSRMTRDKRFKRGSGRGFYALMEWPDKSPSRRKVKRRKSSRMHRSSRKTGAAK